MCLDEIDEYEKPDESGIGYKVFLWTGGELVTPICGNNNPFPELFWVNEFQFRQMPWWGASGRWLVADPDHTGFKVQYETGFHIFETAEGARDYQSRLSGSLHRLPIKKVQWRHQTARGIQFGQRVIVAKEMQILKDEAEQTECVSTM